MSEGDALTVKHLGQKFSTPDQDNDVASYSCAVSYKGAWWYKKCFDANLNGEYNNTETYKGVNWADWLGFSYSLRFTEMKIRPSNV